QPHRQVRSEERDLQGLRAAAQADEALCARPRDRRSGLVLVLLSRRDGQARSGLRQGDRISDALRRQRHARLLRRQGRPHVVRDTAQQQGWLLLCLQPAAQRRGALSGWEENAPGFARVPAYLLWPAWSAAECGESMPITS